MEIRVDGSLDQAMRVLKRKLAKEGVFKEMKKRAFYEKPSVRRKRKRSEAQRRRRKEQRRRRASNFEARTTNSVRSEPPRLIAAANRWI